MCCRAVQSLRLRDVEFQELGKLNDHLARFIPINTVWCKVVPSLRATQRALGIPEFRAAAGGDACDSIGLTLQPYDEYHTLEEGVCLIQNLADAHPQIAGERR